MDNIANKVVIPSSANRLKLIYGQRNQNSKKQDNLPLDVKFYCWSFTDAIKYIGITRETLQYYLLNKPDIEQFVYYDLQAKLLITDTQQILQQIQTENVKELVKKLFFTTNFIHNYKQDLVQIDPIIERWSDKSYVRTDNERSRLDSIVVNREKIN